MNTKKIFAKKMIYYYVYVFLLIITFVLYLANIRIFPYLLFLLLGLGWSIFFFRKYLNIFEHLLIAPLISISLFAVYITLFALLSIKITLFLATIFTITSLILFFKSKIFNNENIQVTITKSDILLASMIIVAFAAKVVSVIGMHTPNLSDEVTHSYLAKLIVDTGYITYFYPPGIHIISAFSTMLGGEGVVKQILYQTNFFSAYSGAIVYLYFKRIFNDKITALVTAFLFSLGIALSNLFYYAGKNAFIIGVSILFLFMFAISFKKYRSSLQKVILSAVILFATFVFHYPLAVFACTYWLAIFLIQFSKHRKNNILVSMGAFGGFVMMAILIRLQSITYPEQTGILSTESSQYLSIPNNYLYSIYTHINKIVYIVRTTNYTFFPDVILLFTIIGSLFFLFHSIKNRKANDLVFLLWIIISFIVSATIYVFAISPINIVLESYFLLTFVFSYFCLSFFIATIYKFLKRYISPGKLFFLFTIFYVSIIVYQGEKTYIRFLDKKGYNIVKDSDIIMFDWIEENIENNEGIIINSYSIITDMVFPSDAGGWITVFSGNKITAPFWEFSNETSHTNLLNYNRLQENINDCGSIKYFHEKGFRYYYQGSIPLSTILATPQDLQENGWELIQSDNNSYLFKMPTCDEL
jgi:hypothetical protein